MDTYSHVNIAWQTVMVHLSLCVSSSIWYAIHYVLRMQENDLLQNSLIRALRTHEGQAAIMRVVAVGDNGRKHLDMILHVLATAPISPLCFTLVAERNEYLDIELVFAPQIHENHENHL